MPNVIQQVVHEANITKVESSTMDTKHKVYHAKIQIEGRNWEKQREYDEACAAGGTPPPFVNSLEMSLRLPTSSIMPNPAQRVRITLEFLPAE